MSKYCVYQLTFPDGSFYIGSTGNLKQRIYQHKGNSRYSSITDKINKYGKDSFEYSILSMHDTKELSEKAEKESILYHIDKAMCLNKRSDKTTRFDVRMKPEEKERLYRMADKHNMKPTDVIRKALEFWYKLMESRQ